MRPARSLFASAFLTDASLYLVFAAIPFRALELGAGPLGLGALPGLYAAAYMISASQAGRWSDRVPRLRLARFAALGAAVAIAGLAAVRTLPALFAALPLLGVALGFFWSPLQAAVSDRAPGTALAPTLGMFNMSWTMGKGTGLVLGGILTAALSPGAVLLVGGAPLLLTAALLPRGPEPAPPPPPAPGAPDGAVPGAVLRLAWMTNALAYGLVGTVNMHAPRFLLAQGAGPATFGLLLGGVFGVQAVVFARIRGRPVDAAMLAVSLTCAMLAVAAFLGLHGIARGLSVVPFGLATGLAYHASLRASVDRSHGRGRAAGLHETVLGAGSTSVPLLGGWVAARTGSLVAPFLVAAVALALGMIVLARFGRRSGAVRVPA